MGAHSHAGPAADVASPHREHGLVASSFFHGIRSNGTVMEAVGNCWASVLPDTESISPDAPFASKSKGREWCVVDDQVMHPDRIKAARRAFDDLVSGIVKREASRTT